MPISELQKNRGFTDLRTVFCETCQAQTNTYNKIFGYIDTANIWVLEMTTIYFTSYMLYFSSSFVYVNGACLRNLKILNIDWQYFFGISNKWMFYDDCLFPNLNTA